MRDDYERAVALGFCEQVKEAGFRPFLAKSGLYGFYTDKEGTKVVSFQTSFSGITLSGNYKTSDPSKTGNGWRIDDKLGIAEAFNESAPKWATGTSTWRHTTAEEHLKDYQYFCEYEELLDEI